MVFNSYNSDYLFVTATINHDDYAKLYVFMGINDKLCRLQKFSQVCKGTKYLDLPKKNSVEINNSMCPKNCCLCMHVFFQIKLFA